MKAMIWLIFLNWMLFLLVVAFMEAEQLESETNRMTATSQNLKGTDVLG